MCVAATFYMNKFAFCCCILWSKPASVNRAAREVDNFISGANQDKSHWLTGAMCSAPHAVRPVLFSPPPMTHSLHLARSGSKFTRNLQKSKIYHRAIFPPLLGNFNLLLDYLTNSFSACVWLAQLPLVDFHHISMWVGKWNKKQLTWRKEFAMRV